MKALFIATILVIGALAVTDDATAIINRLESSHNGKRMLDTIQLQMEAGDPADDLVRMLQDQEDKLEAEQDIADDWILALQNQCVEDLAILVDEIASTRNRIQELEDLLAALIPLRESKTKERDMAVDFKNLLIEKIAEIDAAKVEKDAEWVEEAAAHDSQTAIIQKAKDIIVNGLSASFLQSKAQVQVQVLTQVSQHFNNAKKTHFKTKGLNSIFRVLAQVTASQDIQAASSSIDRIIELCDELLDKIAESRAIEKRDYDLWCKEYNDTKSKLSATLQETLDKIAQLNLEIGVLTKRINMATQELAEQTTRLSEKIQQHDAREMFCDQAGATYAAEREARDDEREIISDAIGLLSAKIRMLKKYVSDRVMTLERPI